MTAMCRAIVFRVAATALFAAALPVASAAATDAQTFIVTTVADAGPGSLRQVIVQANAAPIPDSGSNTIAFVIPGAGLHSIQPHAPLPSIERPVTIDGYTQPGSSPNTLDSGASNAALGIEIDGSGAGEAANGLVFVTGSGGSRVQGLAINRFHGAGIRVVQSNVSIAGNFIGTDASGLSARGNGSGVVFESGDAYSALTLGQYDTSGPLVPAEVNVISGNLGAGIEVVDAAAAVYPSGARIRNNIIGADATGARALGNGGDGIKDAAIGSSGTFGGSVIVDNVIVGNGGHGITEYGRGGRIVDNLIGVGIGTLGANGPALGNTGDGVYVGGSAVDVAVIDHRFSSGATAGRASIAHNGGAGLYIDNNARVDVVNQGFFDNGGLGIDIAPAGPDADDVGDADDGPNEKLNAPVLDALSFDAGSGYGNLAGHLDSNPGLAVEVRFYVSDACDASGFGEGAQVLYFDSQSTGTLDTGADGHTEFTLHSSWLQPGKAVAAITRRFAEGQPYSIVSEFSGCRVVPGSDPIFADGFDGD